MFGFLFVCFGGGRGRRGVVWGFLGVVVVVEFLFVFVRIVVFI